MNNSALHQRKNKALARGQGTLTPAYIKTARGSELWDEDGHRYIDLGSGIAVLNTGHNHPRVQAAVQQQLEHFSHTCLMVTPYASAVELAEKLNRLAPGPSPKKSIFVTTGAEAVENCIKIARAHTGRPGVIAFNGGFHGRTHMTMGLTGKITPYKTGFGPFPADIYHSVFPSEFHGVSVEDALQALDRLFRVEIEPQRVAAMIIEPVQGEGGFYHAPPEFLQALRKLCDEHGIVLIADEIQTGFARTGRLFATEYADIEPDLMTMAKGIAGGVPIAAVVGKAAIMDAPAPGALGGTYGGSPLACAAALAVLDVIETEDLTQRATLIGDTMASRLRALQTRYPDRIGEVRHLGAMVAVELVRQGNAGQPDPETTRAMVSLAAERGLILLSCGFFGNVIRLLPALTMTDELLEESMTLLEGVFESVLTGV